MKLVLLGPQRLRPTLSLVVEELGLRGPIATVTAGWQEYEVEDRTLQNQLGGRTVNLRLHKRCEEIFRIDTELAAAYRARQERLRHYQEPYRIRLEYAVLAGQVITRHLADAGAIESERRSSMEFVRAIDRMHLERCLEVHAEFEARWRPAEREVVSRHRAEVANLAEGCVALAIAGGHVAVLLNRLKLLDVFGVLAGRPVLAWSAGAMALCEKVVLFHDNPPQGPGIAEILEAGIGLCPGVVVFPDPALRLRLDDRERVSSYARRFAPAACLVLGDGARITCEGGEWRNPAEIHQMGVDGGLEAVEPSALARC